MTCHCGYLDYEDEKHAESCDEATVTKGEVVEMIHNGSAQTVKDYLFWLKEGDSPETALAAATNSASESAACYFGLSSCAGGGCKH